MREMIEKTEVYKYVLSLTSGFGQNYFQLEKFSSLVQGKESITRENMELTMKSSLCFLRIEVHSRLQASRGWTQ